MNKIAWLKIPTDMFEKRTIKRILSEKNGDRAVLLLVLLNILAGSVNDNGLVYITEDVPYEESDFSKLLGETKSTVKNSLMLLNKYGEIEIYEDGKILVTAFTSEQNMDSLEKYRERARLRKQKERQKKKDAQINDECHVTVTDCHTLEVEEETEKETEKETEAEKDEDAEVDNIVSSVIFYLNDLSGKNFNPDDDITKSLIKTLLKKGYSESDLKKAVKNKCTAWKGDSKMEVFLRPQTIFGENFDAYLNEVSRSVYSSIDDDIYSNSDFISNLSFYR